MVPSSPSAADKHSTDNIQQRVLSVVQLNEQIEELLERSFPSVWVSGEISNFSRPQSGHCYLTLKDESAQLRAVIWRETARGISLELHDGLEVVCHGHLDVYPPRGSYQLVIDQIEPKGIGALELALRKLRKKLASEGLFDPSRKRSLPPFPQQVAFITSPTGAALRDFLEVLRRRWRGVDVLIVPVRVQGDDAAREIAEAIKQVNRMKLAIDCLVVGRGGGSLEDLWAFNEEVVVRAIYASKIPVISAVGHEIDVTLSDLVADVCALTPSEAAERIAPAADEVQAFLRSQGKRMHTALRGRAQSTRRRLEAISTRRVFRKPLERIHYLAQQLDQHAARSLRAIRHRQNNARNLIASLAARLETLSPLAVLGRGYSLTQRADNAEVVRDAGKLSVGQEITTRFERGHAVSRVERIHKNSTNEL